jgi:hypothetical protein
MSALGAVQSVTPALAPVLGVWLLAAYGWSSSFVMLSVMVGLLCLAVLVFAKHLPGKPLQETGGGYADLLLCPGYLRHGLSQACTLASLLIFVFGAPAVFTLGLGAGINDFIIMQVTGVAFFIAATSFSGGLVSRLGLERTVLLGSNMAALGVVSILIYALLGGTDPLVITACFVPVNVGLGFRAPTGFHQALADSNGNESRGAAIIMLTTFLLTSGGTAIAAPFVANGMVGLAIVASFVAVLSSIILLFAKPKGT